MDSLELSPETDRKDGDTLRGIDLLLDGDVLSSPDETHEKSAAVVPALEKVKHVRSHTAGGGYAQTMERPDIDATIHCVCSVYRAHIENSLHHHQQQAAPHTARLNMDVFRDDFETRQRGRSNTATVNNSIPTVATIQAFYQEFYQRSQMEHDTIIMSLIYVERLMKVGALQPTPDNWCSVLISCMILASKVWGA